MIDAVVERLRPILVTTLTTLGGVLPTAYGIGGYDAVVSPMSLALGWGLAFSTSITLFLVPTLYTLAGDLRAWMAAPRTPFAGWREAVAERDEGQPGGSPPSFAFSSLRARLRAK